MKCMKCGKSNDEGSKYCEHCGTLLSAEEKISNVNSSEKKGKEQVVHPNSPKNTGISKKIIAVAAAAIVAIVAIVIVFSGSKTIPLSDYVVIKTDGYDGYGVANWFLNSQKLMEDYGDDIKLTKDADTDMLGLLSAGDIIELSFSGKLNKTNELSNGDVVTFKWDFISEEEMKKVFKNRFELTDISMTVDNLKEVESFDAFDGITLEYVGFAPIAEARVVNQSNNEIQGLTYKLENAQNLSNGDTVKVIVTVVNFDSVTEYCAEKYGKVPETLEKEFVVDGLSSYVNDIEQIPEDLLNKMKTEVEDQLRAESVNWESQVSLEDVTYIGSYILNRKSSGTRDNNRIYLVYNVGICENYPDEGVENHVNYYYYGAFDDVVLLADGTCSVNLESMEACRNRFTRALDIYENHFFVTLQKKLTYYGFEDLDSMFNQCVVKYADQYTYTSTVEDVVKEEPTKE